MTNIEMVKTAIEKLTPGEYAKLQDWLQQQNSDDQPIDRQLKADLETGKLDDILNQAIADHQAGRTQPL